MTSQAIGEYARFLINHSLNPLPAAKVVREKPDSSNQLPVDKIDAVKFSSTFFSNTAAAVSALEKVIDANLDRSGKVPFADEVYAKFILTAHGETNANTTGKLTGHSGGMLNEKGDKSAEGQKAAVVEQPYMIVSSDLPRAIHHALVKFAVLSADETKALEEIGKKVDAKEKADEADYYGLVNLALDHGIIPTPLARAQDYGRLELHPEKFELIDGAKKKHTAETLDGLVKKFKELEKSKNLGEQKPALIKFLNDFNSANESDQDSLRRLYELALGRKDATEYRSHENLPEDENRPLFYHRVDALLSIFERNKERLKSKQVEIVAHSGFVDVALEYFRHNSKKGEFHLVPRPKLDVRGETVIVKVNEKFEYLNDPLLLKKIREDSEKVGIRQREASLDEGIRNKKNSMIPVELLGFKKEERGNYKSYPVSLDDILKSDKPVLLLGNFGQGKSTAAVELAELLNSDKEHDGKKYKDAYVPVFLTARDINYELPNKLGDDPSKNNSEVLKLLSQEVPKLPIALRKEYTPVFIIDALDELSSDIRESVMYGVRKLLLTECENAKVIATSRFTGFDQYENEGFNTFHVDPNAVIHNLDLYLSGRIVDTQGKPDPQRLKEFKEFLMRQDDGVKTNYLLVHFLSNLYAKNPNELGDLNKPLSEGDILIRGIEHALWDHKVPKGKVTGRQKPYGAQSTTANQPVTSYEKTREDSLKDWMGFLQKVAAYMTVHNTSTIDRKGLEEVQGNWTIADYLSKSKVK